MCTVTHPARDARQESQHQQNEQQRGEAHADERCAIDRVGVLLALVGKAEERCLHAKGENYQQQGYIAIDVGDYAITA